MYVWKVDERTYIKNIRERAFDRMQKENGIGDWG